MILHYHYHQQMSRATTFRAAAATAIMIAIALLVYVREVRPRATPTGQTLPVTASFYPLYFFAQQIGGGLATVVNMTPPGVEPHDYEPTAQDLAGMERARLVILNGAGFEPWGDKIQKNLDPQRTVVLRAGEGLATLQLEEDGTNIVDPHVWLAPGIAQQMVQRIERSFEQVDPNHAADYASNARGLALRLSDLDAAYRKGLAECATRDVTTSHAAFGYLAAAYHFDQIPIAGLSPDAEPSARQLADVARFAKEHHVTTIFFERLVSPKLSQTIATEIGARTMVLDPLEGLTSDEIAVGADYFSVMQQNLTNLQAVLRCTR